MPLLFYIVGVLTLVGGVLTIIAAPTAIQEIGGACLWGFGWMIVGTGAVVRRLTRLIELAPRP